jgi:hypothetical protein
MWRYLHMPVCQETPKLSLLLDSSRNFQKTKFGQEPARNLYKDYSYTA